MRRSLVFVTTAALASAGCFDEAQIEDDERGDTTTLTLSAGENGDFEWCDENGTCKDLPNPNDCATLVIEIDNATGKTCETCKDEDGETKDQSCDEVSVGCVVVTLPDPDCLVCAYIDGAIIYSSCVAEEPHTCYPYGDDPATGANNTPGGGAGAPDGGSSCISDADCAPNDLCKGGLCVPGCEVCYDADGAKVSDNCGQDCSAVLCAEVVCEEGFLPTQLPGDCCPQCAPDVDCSLVDCYAPPIECPEGSFMTQDPMNCCGYICEPTSCDMVMCPAIYIECPEGYGLDFTYPNCCGACVRQDDARYCTSSEECLEGEVCTTADGECSSACDPNTDMVCIEVCTGVCRLSSTECPVYDPPAPEGCSGGTWKSPGYDEAGCPLPPVCFCGDGTAALDGVCGDSCGDVYCAMWFQECEAGYHMEYGYPYCCGACVPDAGGTTCYSSQDCGQGEVCSTELGECGSCGDAAVCCGVCEPMNSP